MHTSRFIAFQLGADRGDPATQEPARGVETEAALKHLRCFKQGSEALLEVGQPGPQVADLHGDVAGGSALAEVGEFGAGHT